MKIFKIPNSEIYTRDDAQGTEASKTKNPIQKNGVSIL